MGGRHTRGQIGVGVLAERLPRPAPFSPQAKSAERAAAKERKKVNQAKSAVVQKVRSAPGCCIVLFEDGGEGGWFTPHAGHTHIHRSARRRPRR